MLLDIADMICHRHNPFVDKDGNFQPCARPSSITRIQLPLNIEYYISASGGSCLFLVKSIASMYISFERSGERLSIFAIRRNLCRSLVYFLYRYFLMKAIFSSFCKATCSTLMPSKIRSWFFWIIG